MIEEPSESAILLSVQRIEVGDIRHRHEMVATEVVTLALNATFIMTLARLQNSAAKRQCERNTTNRTVSSRRWPRRIMAAQHRSVAKRLEGQLTKQHNNYEEVCLQRLAELVAAGCRVTVLAHRVNLSIDNQKLFAFLADLGFGYVTRFRGNIHVTDADRSHQGRRPAGQMHVHPSTPEAMAASIQRRAPAACREDRDRDWPMSASHFRSLAALGLPAACITPVMPKRRWRCI